MSRNMDLDLLVKIARMYYEDGMTQQMIARQMNMSRSLISKLLTKAKDIGIVKITIRDELNRPCQELEEHLKSVLGLTNVLLASGDYKQDRQSVAGEAGRYLTMRLSEVSKVAVSAGRTTREIANIISLSRSYSNVTFIPMSGGLSEESAEIEANSVSEAFALKCGAKHMRLHAPIVVDSVQAKEVLKNQYFIKNVFDVARTADIALVGIGSTFRYAEVEEAYLHGYSEFDISSCEIIKGDLSYNFFDKNGSVYDCKWNQLLMGLSLKEISGIPEVICVASEIEKAESIYIAAKNHLIHTLITNEGVAQKVLWYRAKDYGLL